MKTYQSRFGIGDCVLVGTERGVILGVTFTTVKVVYVVEFEDYAQEVDSCDVNPA